MLGFNESFAADSQNLRANMGTLHEILLGKELNGGKHMPGLRDNMGTLPKQKHDEIKKSLRPDQYREALSRAKAHADHIKDYFRKNHGLEDKHIHNVHWVAQPGTSYQVTGVDSGMSEDPSDLVITAKNGNKKQFHTLSVKSSQKRDSNVLANSGAAALHGVDNDSIVGFRNKLGKIVPNIGTSSYERRQKLAKAGPKAQEAVTGTVRKYLEGTAKNTVKHLNTLDQKGMESYLRKHVLSAQKTPVQEKGMGTHHRTTIYGGDGNYEFETHDPSTDYDHIIKDRKNITVHHDGVGMEFRHKGEVFAKNSVRLANHEDPFSSLQTYSKLRGALWKEHSDKAKQSRGSIFGKNFHSEHELE